MFFSTLVLIVIFVSSCFLPPLNKHSVRRTFPFSRVHRPLDHPPVTVPSGRSRKTCAIHLVSTHKLHSCVPSKWDYWYHGSHAYWVSKIMIRILRHRDDLREADGAAAWETLRSEFDREELGMDIREGNSSDSSVETEEEHWFDTLMWKWQRTLSILFEFCRKHSVLACHSRSIWRKRCLSVTAGRCERTSGLNLCTTLVLRSIEIQ